MYSFLCNPHYFVRNKNEGRYGFPKETAAKAMAFDPTPIVERNESSVSVCLLGFSNWVGFYSKMLTFSRNPPHRILNEKMEVLEEYESSHAVFGGSIGGIVY